MSITTVSSREFARDLARVKRATATGPVFVTNRGKPAYALLKIEDFYQLEKKKSRSLLEAMDALPRGDFEVEFPRLDDMGFRPADLE